MADVEARSERMVEKDSVRSSLPKHDIERHRHVDRIGRSVVSIGIAVPHHVRIAAQLSAAFVKPAVLFAEPIDVLVVAQALPRPDRRARVRGAVCRIVLVERRAIARQDLYLKWLLSDDDAKSGCVDG